MSNKNNYRNNYDYEEDDYDRLKTMDKPNAYHKSFTNKVTLKKCEYDYEEDPYEPKKGV